MVVYIFLCIVIGMSVFSSLSSSGRTWAALISLVLFILIFVFYGMRWFGQNPTSVYKGTWPPIINMCPDYLVYYKNGSVDTCVDILGVNRSGGGLKAWTKEDSPSNPPTDKDKYFNYVYRSTMTPTELQNLCQATMNVGLTWEGITNGESCTFTSQTSK